MEMDNNMSACSTYLKQQTILDKPFDAFLYNSSAPKNETLATLKTLSTWFREQFPYFYDQCRWREYVYICIAVLICMYVLQLLFE